MEAVDFNRMPSVSEIGAFYLHGTHVKLSGSP